MDLDTASQIAKTVLQRIQKVVDRVEIAGSIRRKKSSVKDVELVVMTNNYEELYKRLSRVGRFIKPGTPEIIDWEPKMNAKYVRMLLNEGIKLDMFVANPDNWGALLCMRTGSAANGEGDSYAGFVPKMFSQWKRASGGGKMSQCQPMMPDGLLLSVPEEQDFFDLCNVRWVDPELRIDASAVKVISR